MHFPFSPDGPTSPAASGPTPPLPGSVQAHRGPVTSTHRPLEIAEVNRCSFSLPFSLPILNPRAYRRWQLGGGLRQGHIGVGARVSYVQWRHGYGHTGRCESSSQRKLQGAGGHEPYVYIYRSWFMNSWSAWSDAYTSHCMYMNFSYR
jgi:hypothetical protein